MLNDRPSTAVFTDIDSPEIDQAQYASGRGPCLEAFKTGSVRLIDSTRADQRWPEFNESCLDHGILSTLSLPLSQGSNHFGAMNMYSRTEHAFTEQVVDSVVLFAEQASIVLANAAAYWDAKLLSEQLSESIESRAVIEQAKGIIMGSMRCTADEAFRYLVQQSQTTNTKLHSVAEAIVRDVGGRNHA
jgi:GAF domain-containing protein